MRFGVYTPTHRATYVRDAWESLREQALPEGVELRWRVLLNGDAKEDHYPRELMDAPWVSVGRSAATANVGQLKRQACESLLADGCDVLLELDHDDALAPECVMRVLDSMPAGGFVASDCAMQETPYRADLGWRCSTAVVQGNRLWVPRTPEICSRSLFEIFYAPNHVRAWSREAYGKVGGYDAALQVADDHDLLCRTYLAGIEMALVHEPLYIQRKHAGQTQAERNAEVQTAQAAVGARHLYALATEEAHRRGLACIDLGGVIGCPAGYLSVDMRDGADVQLDVREGLPFGDGEVGVVRAHDFLEHIEPDHVPRLMNEIFRVLAPGGWLLTSTPSTDGRGAWQDPTHRSGWNSNSWWYYTRAAQAQYVPQYTGRFQLTRVVNHFPSDWHKMHNIVYCDAALWALKGQQQIGAVEI